jgi:hypothetical protein
MFPSPREENCEMGDEGDLALAGALTAVNVPDQRNTTCGHDTEAEISA